MKKTLLSAFLSLNFSFLISAQDFYAVDTIQKIEISFSQSNWDYILDTAKQGSDSYTMSQWVKINGVQFDSAGVKYKGNSSYNPNNAKNPFHIELDHFKSQDYLGYKDIKLSNGYNEPSFVREVMLYSIFQNYAEASRANFAQVYVNSQYIGVYTNVEAVTKTFLADRFYSNNNTFVFADNGACDLRYKGNDTTLYYNPYTLKSDYGWTDLKNLCDSLKNNINGIENILDVDRTLWLLAYLNALVILDSYIGNGKHNYYIYENHNGRFNPIIWDLNGGLGTFNTPGPGNITQYTVSQMQTMTPMLHANDSMWPLVKNILAIPMYKRMYIAHMKTIMSENIANNYYFTFAQYIQSIADTAVQSDPNKFGTYSQFLNNLTTNVVIGPKTIPGISFLMNARNTYLNSTPEFQQVPPVISNIQSSNTFPLLNTNVFITATVSNATAVYLGRRYSIMEQFTRMMMYDDGLHGDGAATDGIYGISISVTSPEIQYYIYAENNNAGIFSPQRAEHEYYTLDANYTTISAGEVVINEFMAMNSTTVQNVNGVYADWIELYNNSSNTVSLDYLHLSDDVFSSTKWQFPQGINISPNQYLIVWADEDTSPTEVHCNFKLSGSGEQLILSYANGYVIDSIGFFQQTSNISFGRFPNGTGPFVSMPPTFNAQNSLVGIEEPMNESDFYIYPNPCLNNISVQLPVSGLDLKIFDVLGNLVFAKTKNGKQEILNLNLESGVYFLRVENDSYFQTKKILVQQ